MKIRDVDLPIFDQVHSDGALTERELQVWRATFKRLDLVVFRVLKLLDIERMTGIAKSTISVCLDRLCQLGYLVRQRDSGNAAWEYRIPLSRSPSAEGSAGSADTPIARRVRRSRSRMISRGV